MLRLPRSVQSQSYGLSTVPTCSHNGPGPITSTGLWKQPPPWFSYSSVLHSLFPTRSPKILLTPKSAPILLLLTSLPGLPSQSKNQSPPAAHRALQDPPLFPLCPHSLCSSHTSLTLTKTLLPQGLCTCCSLRLEFFSPRFSTAPSLRLYSSVAS